MHCYCIWRHVCLYVCCVVCYNYCCTLRTYEKVYDICERAYFVCGLLSSWVVTLKSTSFFFLIHIFDGIILPTFKLWKANTFVAKYVSLIRLGNWSRFLYFHFDCPFACLFWSLLNKKYWPAIFKRKTHTHRVLLLSCLFFPAMPRWSPLLITFSASLLFLWKSLLLSFFWGGQPSMCTILPSLTWPQIKRFVALIVATRYEANIPKDGINQLF